MDSSKNCCPFVTKLCAVTKLGDLTVRIRFHNTGQGVVPPSFFVVGYRIWDGYKIKNRDPGSVTLLYTIPIQCSRSSRKVSDLTGFVSSISNVFLMPLNCKYLWVSNTKCTCPVQPLFHIYL